MVHKTTVNIMHQAIDVMREKLWKKNIQEHI